MKLLSLSAALGALALAAVTAVAADSKPASADAIGVYDSRAVAYAHFWTPEQQAKLKALHDSAKAAKAEGNNAQFRAQEKEIKAGQQRIHRQVFGSEAIPEALESLKDRLPELQKEAGVSQLISQWDKATLDRFPDARRVDVTDLLVREFKPGEKQKKVIAEMRKHKPLPNDQCDD